MRDLLQFNTRPFMDMLTPAIADRVRAEATISKFTNGQLIQSRGDTRAGLSIIRSGAGQMGVFGEDGTFVMMSVLGPGQTFGEVTLFTDIPRTQDFVAIGPTEIYQLPAARFRALCEDEPGLLETLLSITLARSHFLLDVLDSIRRLPLRERVAKTLYSMDLTAGQHGHIQCRQEDLADMIGISRVSLSKALKDLTALGLIKLGYGSISFPDVEKFRDWVARHCNVAIVS
ncbi:Crp/Fnr family transcriptional regulator [Pyruvatibacter sp.]